MRQSEWKRERIARHIIKISRFSYRTCIHTYFKVDYTETWERTSSRNATFKTNYITPTTPHCAAIYKANEPKWTWRRKKSTTEDWASKLTKNHMDMVWLDRWLNRMSEREMMCREKEEEENKVHITITTISGILSLSFQRNSVLVLHAHCAKTIVKKSTKRGTSTHTHRAPSRHTDKRMHFGLFVWWLRLLMLYVNFVKISRRQLY